MLPYDTEIYTLQPRCKDQDSAAAWHMDPKMEVPLHPPSLSTSAAELIQLDFSNP